MKPPDMENRGDVFICAYYHLKKLPDDSSKQRMNLIKSNGYYEPIERYRKPDGEISFYIGSNNYSRTPVDLAIKVSGGKHISRIEHPEINAKYATGDVKDTNDALLFKFKNFARTNSRILPNSEIEIFVVKGANNDKVLLYSMAIKGLLDEDMKYNTFGAETPEQVATRLREAKEPRQLEFDFADTIIEETRFKTLSDE